MAKEFQKLTIKDPFMFAAVMTKEDIIDLLSELGVVPEDIRGRIMGEGDENVLRKWVRSAAKAESFEIFRKNM